MLGVVFFVLAVFVYYSAYKFFECADRARWDNIKKNMDEWRKNNPPPPIRPYKPVPMNWRETRPLIPFADEEEFIDV